VLGSDTSLKELNMNNNNLQDSGVIHLCTGLKSVNCKLEILSAAAQEALLKELDLSEVKLGDLDGGKLSALFMDSHSKLEKIKLNNCRLTEKSCSVLATVLSSKTILKEMNLNNSRLLDSGVKEICEGLKNSVCELKILKLCDCGLTDESCSALATVLRSNSSLKELDLSNNNLLDSGVKKLQNGLENTNCTLENLSKLHRPYLSDHFKLLFSRLSNCGISEEGYKALASALRSNPSHLIELDLTGNDPGQSGVKELNDLLQDPNCQLKTLSLWDCSITEKQCLILTSALKSNPSHLRELDLSGNKIENTGVNHLCDVLKDSHCKLEQLSHQLALCA
uniref:Uncharacterized protein n=1 Tax=Sinocyclocheilus rhinocerous TaxID=307959 RepID=A0A673HRW7_9TELE